VKKNEPRHQMAGYEPAAAHGHRRFFCLQESETYCTLFTATPSGGGTHSTSVLSHWIC